MSFDSIQLDQEIDSRFSNGNVASALELINDGCHRRMAVAMRWRGFLLLGGTYLPRNLVGARHWLSAAAAAGDDAAGWAEISLAANGSGGPVDWAAALGKLQQLAVDHPDAKLQADYITSLNLDPHGYPIDNVSSEIICDDPIIEFIPDFCTEFECKQIVNCAADLLEPSFIVDPVTRNLKLDPIRTSYSATIGPTRENLIVATISRRIASHTSTNLSSGENFVLLRYQAGQQYFPHLDAISGSKNQRFMTAILYLNEAFGGGDTIFPRLEKSVRPRAGSLLVFRNLDSNGAADLRTLHAGTPVTRGAKWIATRWIREQPFDPWTADQT